MPQAIPEKKRSQKNEAQRANLRLIMDYLTHVKHSHAISRNLLLIETMKGSSAATSAGRSAAGSVSGRTTKPEEFVRVYDILIQVGGNCKLLVNSASKISSVCASLSFVSVPSSFCGLFIRIWKVLS